MNYYNSPGQMDLSDRMAIEVGLTRKDSFRKIAQVLRRHPTTIAKEVKQNRTYISGNYWHGKDCHYVRTANMHHICGDMECEKNCCSCQYDCRRVCPRYKSVACHRFEKPPYVCNSCHDRNRCQKEKYIYSAKYADAVVTRRRSESRQGVRIAPEEMKALDALVTRLVKKGQPLVHIYAEHKDEIPVGLRSLYVYIDKGLMKVRNIDLRRKTGYKHRKGTHKEIPFSQKYREGRTYEDFESLMAKAARDSVIEMDTVKGVRESGKRLLTMIMRKNSVMLLFLMPDGTADSVVRVFDYLEKGLGINTFQRLFPVILTDNGSEFKRIDALEYSDDLQRRTSIYFCDPMASWQKPHIEKNHEYIRYVLPKGKSFSPYTQEDITLLMNHINSTRRPGLNNKAPYELVDANDEDMMALFNLMKMHLIPPDEVHLKPDLFLKKN